MSLLRPTDQEVFHRLGARERGWISVHPSDDYSHRQAMKQLLGWYYVVRSENKYAYHYRPYNYLYSTNHKDDAFAFAHVYTKAHDCELQVQRLSRYGKTLRTWHVARGSFSDWLGDDF